MAGQGIAAEWSTELNDPREDIYTLDDGRPLNASLTRQLGTLELSQCSIVGEKLRALLALTTEPEASSTVSS